jgi:hypothetical protein
MSRGLNIDEDGKTTRNWAFNEKGFEPFKWA